MKLELEKIRRTFMIEGYLQELCKSLGGPMRPVSPEPLFRMYREKRYTDMVGHIRNSLNLKNLKVVVGKVNSGGPKNAAAWIALPEPMPMFISKEFRELQVTVYIRKDYIQREPFELIVKTIAHEFCHVVLRSTKHKLENSEEATDLAAMTLGYHEFYLKGFEAADRAGNGLLKIHNESAGEYMRRLVTIVTGAAKYEAIVYLSTSEVRFAHDWIKKRLK